MTPVDHLPVLLLGMNHRTAAIAEREALAFSPEESLALLRDLCRTDACDEALVLTTCNRAEFYLVGGHERRAEQCLRALIRARRGRDLLGPGSHRYRTTGRAAVRHLFRVASGLDSMVLGDVQVLGQVKHALQLAREAGTVGPVLERLLQRALRAGKRARAETRIATGVVSMGSAAVRLLRQELGSRSGSDLLVVGAGETGRLVATHLACEREVRITIANRGLGAAERLARAVGGQPIPLTSLASSLVHADAAIFATSAPGPVASAEMMAGVIAGRGGRRLLLIDLAVPRDVEPAAAALPGVVLHTVDDVRRVVDDNLARRIAEIPHVERIIDDELDETTRWSRHDGSGMIRPDGAFAAHHA
jgi:glutamyl-tRNA reductase